MLPKDINELEEAELADEMERAVRIEAIGNRGDSVRQSAFATDMPTVLERDEDTDASGPSRII